MRRIGDGEDVQALRDTGLSWHEVGQHYNEPSENVRKRAETWRKKNPDRTAKPYQTIANVGHAISGSTVKQQSITSGCWEIWQAHNQKLKSLNRHARLAFWTDVHLPYQDDYAIELAAKITSDFDPDVVTSLSDDFDFAKISKFVDNRSHIESVWDDDVYNAVLAHASLMNIKRDAAPNAAFPALPGNHDIRIINYTRNTSPYASEYLIAGFLQDIVSNGVLWLGKNLHNNIALRLNERLTLLHGEFATKVLETTMKSHLEMYAYQTSVIFGHVHRSGSRWWRGINYDVQAVSCPCLCDLNPFYTKRRVNWQQGIALTHYDPNGTFQNTKVIDFTRNSGYLTAYYGDKEYRVKVPN